MAALWKVMRSDFLCGAADWYCPAAPAGAGRREGDDRCGDITGSMAESRVWDSDTGRSRQPEALASLDG